MKLIKIKKEYTKKDGTIGTAVNFYLECENGQRLEVSPVVRTYGEKKTSNYNLLNFMAEERAN